MHKRFSWHHMTGIWSRGEEGGKEGAGGEGEEGVAGILEQR